MSQRPWGVTEPLCAIEGHCAFLVAPPGTRSYHHWEVPCLEDGSGHLIWCWHSGSKDAWSQPKLSCVTPLQRDVSSMLALLQEITRLWNGPGPFCPGAPVSHGTSSTLRFPHLNHSLRCEGGSHLLPAGPSLLSSKGSFQDAVAKPRGNFMEIELTLIFKVI